MTRRKADRFNAVALRLAEVIGAGDCQLAGALAVAAHGFVRATKDVDLVARIPLGEAQRRLQSAGVPSTLFRGDVLEGDFPCLRGKLEETPFDVLPPLVAVDWEGGGIVLENKQTRLRVVSLETLLAFKLKAQGPKDLMDAAMLVLLHPESERAALELARSYRVADRFRIWLEDPRMKRDARALMEGEALEVRKAAGLQRKILGARKKRKDA